MIKTYIKSIAFGFLGTVLALGLWVLVSTAYHDHQMVTGLVNIELQREKAAQSQK